MEVQRARVDHVLPERVVALAPPLYAPEARLVAAYVAPNAGVAPAGWCDAVFAWLGPRGLVGTYVPEFGRPCASAHQGSACRVRGAGERRRTRGFARPLINRPQQEGRAPRQLQRAPRRRRRRAQLPASAAHQSCAWQQGDSFSWYGSGSVGPLQASLCAGQVAVRWTSDTVEGEVGTLIAQGASGQESGRGWSRWRVGHFEVNRGVHSRVGVQLHCSLNASKLDAYETLCSCPRRFLVRVCAV